MTIGEKICQLRQNKLMTQKELAEKLNVSDKVISRWERGVSLPDVEMMKKISIVLEVSISELYDYINVENKEKKDNEVPLSYLFIRNNIVAYCLLLIAPIILFVMMSMGNEHRKQEAILETISIIITVLLYLSSNIMEILSCFKFYYFSKTKNEVCKPIFYKYLIIYICILIISIILFFLVGTEIIYFS